MANNKLRLNAVNLRDKLDMLPVFDSSAMPIDTWNVARLSLTASFIVMAQGIDVPISWESPPILERMNR